MAATIPGAGITTPLTLTTTDNTDTLTLVSTDTDANYGPNIEMSRPVTGATNDLLGRIDFSGQDAAGNTHNYFSIEAIIADATSGGEEGRFLLRTEVAGATKNMMDINGSEIVFNEDSVDYNFRVESDGNANCFKVDGGLSAIGINGDATSANYPLTVGANSKTYSYIKINNTTSGTGEANGVDLGISGVNVLYYLIENGDHIFYNGATPAERFRIANNGDLTATDTSISSNSDQRLKKDIVDHTYDISKFKQFKPRSFAWRNPEAHANEATTGFVAQEVESVDSDWASSIAWEENDKTSSLPKYAEEKTLCNNEDRKTSKLGKKDAMYISVIQQLITRIEALEDA
tara:strand:+ start:42 stop:1079 length:1038 start_codon:yes stop_codon:yes gene_type:complete